MSGLRFIMPLVLAMTILHDSTVSIPIDELIADAANSSQQFEFFYDDVHEMIKLEYDILVSYDEYDEMRNVDEEGDDGWVSRRKKRTAGVKFRRREAGRWINNVVNYQFLTGFTSRDRSVFQSAIDHWERYTCLTFVEDNHAANRLQIKDGGGCYSRLGMSGGPQPLSLSQQCRHKPIIIHEIGHAIGLYHEQTRPDRDDYVTVVRNNIAPDMLHNFEKNTWETVQQMGLPYDYMSIMHYGKKSFSYNNRVTIRTVDPAYQDLIGEVYTLSFLDIKTVNKMYNCKRHKPGCTKRNSECPGEGFVGKDCTCWCRGDVNNRGDADPIRPCDGDSTPRPMTRRPTSRPRPTFRPRPLTRRPIRPRPNTPRPTLRPTTACEDQHRSCSLWSSHGECSANPWFMHQFCKRSCNRCGRPGGERGRGGGEGGEVTVPPCEDSHENCGFWQRMNYCNVRYRNIVRPRCKRSCGLCPEVETTEETVITNCVDRSSLCGEWSRRGECWQNPAFMLTQCKRSCNRCINNSGTRNTQEQETGTGGGFFQTQTQERRISGCVDRHMSCGYWATFGACQASPVHMASFCPHSCGFSC